jgi:Holliday junction DNA helicase RuvA
MIAHLRGTLLAKHPNQVIVETHGVGYDVTISVPTFTEMPAAGAEVALHIYTHVREDALSLYGFLRLAEKHLFEKLLTVSGIGPTLAIKILSGMPADEMMGAIRGGDLARLTRIPGIGRKTAERMVLELRDKLPPPGASDTSTSVALASPVEEDVISALVNLGYQRAAARLCSRRAAARVLIVSTCCFARRWDRSRSNPPKSRDDWPELCSAGQVGAPATMCCR